MKRHREQTGLYQLLEFFESASLHYLLALSQTAFQGLHSVQISGGLFYCLLPVPNTQLPPLPESAGVSSAWKGWKLQRQCMQYADLQRSLSLPLIYVENMFEITLKSLTAPPLWLFYHPDAVHTVIERRKLHFNTQSRLPSKPLQLQYNPYQPLRAWL